MSSKAIPSHLRPQVAATAGNGAPEKEFERKHHGKTQSHVVSSVSSDLFINPKKVTAWCLAVSSVLTSFPAPLVTSL